MAASADLLAPLRELYDDNGDLSDDQLVAAVVDDVRLTRAEADRFTAIQSFCNGYGSLTTCRKPVSEPVNRERNSPRLLETDIR